MFSSVHRPRSYFWYQKEFLKISTTIRNEHKTKNIKHTSKKNKILLWGPSWPTLQILKIWHDNNKSDNEHFNFFISLGAIHKPLWTGYNRAPYTELVFWENELMVYSKVRWRIRYMKEGNEPREQSHITMYLSAKQGKVAIWIQTKSNDI